MKNTLIKNLILFSFIVISFFFANSAFANSGYSVSYNPSYYNDVISSNNILPDSLFKKQTVSDTSKINSSDNTIVDSESSEDNSSNEDESNLTASAYTGITALSLKGSGDFMPSSIWQWILTFILVLVVVILGRVVFNNYKAKHIAYNHSANLSTHQ